MITVLHFLTKQQVFSVALLTCNVVMVYNAGGGNPISDMKSPADFLLWSKAGHIQTLVILHLLTLLRVDALGNILHLCICRGLCTARDTPPLSPPFLHHRLVPHKLLRFDGACRRLVHREPHRPSNHLRTDTKALESIEVWKMH